MINTQRRGYLSLLIFSIVAVLTGACSKEEPSTETKATASATSPTSPDAAYKTIVAAAERQDFGTMYDMLDSAYKQYWRMMVNANVSQIDRLDSVEALRWTQIKGMTDMRKAFIAYMTMTPAMWAHYRGSFQINHVDTIVRVVASHSGGQPQATYYRWENGSYRMTAPPEAIVAPAIERVPTGESAPPTGAP